MRGNQGGRRGWPQPSVKIQRARGFGGEPRGTGMAGTESCGHATRPSEPNSSDLRWESQERSWNFPTTGPGGGPATSSAEHWIRCDGPRNHGTVRTICIYTSFKPPECDWHGIQNTVLAAVELPLRFRYILIVGALS